MTGQQSIAPAGPGAADPLAGLKDWHLPDPLSWWPPAPGWWVLALLALALAALAVRRWRAGRRRTAAGRAALGELRWLGTRWGADGDGRGYAAAVSALLRRLALARYPRERVAGLSGDAWLDFLDRSGGGGGFRSGVGRALTELPYRPGPGLETQAGDFGEPAAGVAAASGARPDLGGLAPLAERWIRAHWVPRP